MCSSGIACDIRRFFFRLKELEEIILRLSYLARVVCHACFSRVTDLHLGGSCHQEWTIGQKLDKRVSGHGSSRRFPKTRQGKRKTDSVRLLSMKFSIAVGIRYRHKHFENSSFEERLRKGFSPLKDCHQLRRHDAKNVAYKGGARAIFCDVIGKGCKANCGQRETLGKLEFPCKIAFGCILRKDLHVDTNFKIF